MKTLIATALASLMLVTASTEANAYSFFSTKNVIKAVETKAEEVMAPKAQVRTFAAGTTYASCFVPDGPSCENLIVNAINHTQRSLLIQAYSFTSPPIAEATVQAFKRGVDVRVIVDHSQVTEKYTSATFLKHAGIPVVVDTQPAIAHNKVMIFDQQSVFTGSFNFTRSAQQRNAENGIIIGGDPTLVRLYTDNWTTRFHKSSAY